MIKIVILLLTLALLFYQWVQRRYKYWTDRGVLQEKPTFPVGSMRFDRHFVYRMLETLHIAKPGRIFGSYNFLSPVITVYDLDLVKNILVKDFHHFIHRGAVHNARDDPLSEQLFVIEGMEKWKRLRAKMSPAFTSGKMKYMFPTVVSVGERFYEVLCKKLETENEIEMKDWLARFTTDMIGAVAFGLECNSLVDPKAKFREIGMKTLSESRYPLFMQGLIMMYPKLIRLLRLKLLPDEVVEYFTEAVAETVEYRFKNNIHRNDFMDLLIHLRNEKKSNRKEDTDMNGLSMNEITAQSLGVFLAGFETSSTAMSLTLYELAQNQGIQEKARKSVQEVLARYDGKITYEALKEMTYLNQCLDEGMRKYPPLPVLTRIVEKPYKVPGTQCTLEKGKLVIIPVYNFHHDPEYFPNPEVFNPDHFTEEKVKARNPFCYLPFGEGPRNCIAMRFGIMQARMGLALLLNKFKFKLSPKTPVPIVFNKNLFVLTGEEGLHFIFEKL